MQIYNVGNESAGRCLVRAKNPQQALNYACRNVLAIAARRANADDLLAAGRDGLVVHDATKDADDDVPL